jgi:hypothetical protein
VNRMAKKRFPNTLCFTGPRPGTVNVQLDCEERTAVGVIRISAGRSQRQTPGFLRGGSKLAQSEGALLGGWHLAPVTDLVHGFIRQI